MRLRNIPGAEEALENSKYVIKQPENDRGHFREQIFGNENPIHIEIGMGKGKFLLAMAQQNPAVNYIGIELYSSVLLRAVQKMEELEKENKAPSNIRFLCIDARKLGRLGQLLVAHRTAHTVGHALPDCAAEGGCVLGHIGDFVPPGTQVQLVQILASHGNGPLIRAVQPLQQT